MEYRDKDDKRELPEIPKRYDSDFLELLKYLQFEGARATLKLRKIYSFLDSYGEFVSTFSVCAKGCAHCCRIEVSITDIEAKLIEEETGRRRNTSKKNPPVDYCSPCPFLTEADVCAIYHVRPFHCRTFHTLDDPKYCAINGEPHQIYGSWKGRYTVPFYAKLNRIIRDFVRNNPISDIRDFFS